MTINALFTIIGKDFEIYVSEMAINYIHPPWLEKILKFTLSQMTKNVLKSSTSNSQLELEKLI